MAAINSKYESFLIVSCKLDEEGIAAVVKKFQDLIEANAEAESVSVDVWGKRVLAYQINKESTGYYVLFKFASDAEFPAELDRVYKITDGVLRSLIVKLDA
ncbi:MAG: 30S ribosomal protein S6 [Oscillospiraceae bacterium]|nr:30S ribosomal protein S6 [Oscillospiraceae bacterium]